MVFISSYIPRFQSTKLKLEDFKPKFDSMKLIIPLGFSVFINQIAILVQQISINNVLRNYGALSVYGSDTPLAAMGIISKISMIVISVCLGIDQGGQPIMGYNYGAKKYDRDSSIVVKNKSGFKAPISKDRNGNYKFKSGDFVRVCMTSDFFIEEADEWRDEAWDIIRQRPDVTFSLLTKRATRIKECLPKDWGTGWDNVQIAVSTENQKRVDERIPYLLDIPCKSRWVSIKPFIGEVNLEEYLKTGKIYAVLAGGENYEGSRPLHYEWVKSLQEQCKKYNVKLIFAQTGNYFVKDGKEYKIFDRTTQNIQAIKSNLSYPKLTDEQIEQKLIQIDNMKRQNKIIEKEKFNMTREDIIEFIKKQKKSIISSVGEDGYPATRALIQPVLIDGNDIYFATYTSSRKVRHYQNNSKACVYFYEKGMNFRGVELKGGMIVLTDQKIKNRFWKPFFTRFYKKGVTDPDYCILKFTGFEAEWFSNQKTEIVKM